MAIDWALSAALIAHLKKIFDSQADRAVSRQADGIVGRIYRRFVPDKHLVDANKIFVGRFAKELDSAIDLPELQMSSYQEALERFLCNPSVQDILAAPLDGTSPLDWEILKGIWESIGSAVEDRLIELPADFDWAKVAKRYAEAVKNQMLADPELRPIVSAVAAARTAEATERTAIALEKHASASRIFDLVRYAAAVKTHFSYLILGPLDADWTQYENRVRLEAVYVPQSVKRAIPASDLMRDYKRRQKPAARAVGGEQVDESGRQEPEYSGSSYTRSMDPADDQRRSRKDEQELREEISKVERQAAEYSQVLSTPLMQIIDNARYARIVLLGDPGLGKSTLLKLLTLRWANAPDRPLALFMELRRAAEYENLLDYMESGPLPTCCFPKAELDDYLKKNPSLVLFDALDEVSEGLRTDAVLRITSFVNDYPNARVIVTTRIRGYHPGSTHPEILGSAGFEQFTLQDFDEPEIDSFISLWHRHAFTVESDKARYEQRVRRAVDESSAIRELACNPLLLTLMVIVSRTQDLPRDRCKLYEKCSELLLKNWDLEKFPELKERRDDRDIKDKVGPDQKMRILELVAAAMQKERTGLEGNLIAQEKLSAIVTGELAVLGVQPAWAVADDLIWMLRERNFMLGYLGGRQYAFVHRTFLEYFSARDFKFRLERTSSLSLSDLCLFFRQNWQWDVWHEVLRLLCGIIGAEHAGKCISELLAQATRRNGYQAVFLAAQCLQEVREIGSVAAMRAQARNMLLELADFKFPFYEAGDAATKERIRIQIAATMELARGWRDDGEILPWLMDRAANAEGWAARYSALSVLGRGWRSDHHVLKLLKTCAVGDSSPPVRQVAARELARGWCDLPDTLPYLKEIVLLDDDPSVRGTVVDEVARIWRDDPETLPWLVALASIGGDPARQRAALLAAQRGWANHPSVSQLLDELEWDGEPEIDFDEIEPWLAAPFSVYRLDEESEASSES